MRWFKGEKKEEQGVETPSITFKMVPIEGGQKVVISVDWPEGANLEAFAYMLVFLQQGKLLDLVATAIVDKVKSSTIQDNAAVIEHVFTEGFKMRAASNKPIVCPTKATSLLLKPFQH
jgi:hypothetical protein